MNLNRPHIRAQQATRIDWQLQMPHLVLLGGQTSLGPRFHPRYPHGPIGLWG